MNIISKIIKKYQKYTEKYLKYHYDKIERKVDNSKGNVHVWGTKNKITYVDASFKDKVKIVKIGKYNINPTNYFHIFLLRTPELPYFLIEILSIWYVELRKYFNNFKYDIKFIIYYKKKYETGKNLSIDITYKVFNNEEIYKIGNNIYYDPNRMSIQIKIKRKTK